MNIKWDDSFESSHFFVSASEFVYADLLGQHRVELYC